MIGSGQNDSSTGLNGSLRIKYNHLRFVGNKVSDMYTWVDS